MGGYGSGRYLRRAVKNSRCVNLFSTVDIRQVRKERPLQPGERLRVEFHTRRPSVYSGIRAYRVGSLPLRPFVECLGCGRRCCLLYLAEQCACRQCLGLSYPVQFETKQNQGFRRT